MLFVLESVEELGGECSARLFVATVRFPVCNSLPVNIKQRILRVLS